MTLCAIKIGDMGRIVTGDTPPKRKPEFYGSSYPFIKPTDMEVGCRYTYSFEECYSEEAYEKYKKKLIPAGATAVVTIGSIGQKLTLTHTPCFVNQAVNAVIPDSSRFDSLYVYYLLRHNLHLVKSADTGASSGRENVSKGNFSGLAIVANLDLSAQQRIAALLSAYDDLIENNQRRIKLLEEAARLLYREWFVALRFPGHERVKVVDGLPQGWMRAQLDGICQEVKDLVHPSEVEPTSPYLSMEHMPSRSICLGVWETANKVGSTKAKFMANDVLFGKIRPYFHKVGIAQVSGITSTDVIVMRAKLPKFLSLLAMIVSADEFVGHAVTTSNGTKMPRANWQVLRKWPILVPPEQLMADYAAKTLPIFNQIKMLSLQTRLSREARDTLLPRLMSGALAV